MKLLASFACLLAAIVTLPAQVSLTGTSYSQNFDSIGSGLPAGWSVRTDADASNLGTVTTYSGTKATWSNTTGNFRNVASSTGNDETPYTGSESTTVQNNTLNRSLAIRQTGSFGDPGAAFVFQIENTLGYDNFELSLDFNMLSVQGRSTIWKLEYGVGTSPTSFTQVGTDYTDPGVFGTTTKTFSLSGIADQSENVWIRVVTFVAAPGSGSRDTFGIDNFHLTYSVAVPPEGPPVISAHPQDATVWQGTNVTFSVEATGAEPLAYQWYLDNNPIANGTASALALSNVSTNQAGSYHVEVSNAEGTVPSDAAILTIKEPVIATIAELRNLVDTENWLPPQTDTLYQIEGLVTTYRSLAAPGNASFYLQDATAGIAVYVSNTQNAPLIRDRARVLGRLSHFNGLLQLTVDVSNPTHKYIVYAPSLPLDPPIPLDFATQFDIPAIEALEGSRVVISNVYIDLTQPNFIGNTTITITNAADPTQTFDLRIEEQAVYFDGTAKPTGVTTLIGVLGQYDTTDPRTNGYQLLPTFFIDDVRAGPRIAEQPQSQNVLVGEPVTLSVLAYNMGVGTLYYQWRKNGGPIPGATTSALSIPAAAISDTGFYSVLVGSTNATAPSAEAYLGVGSGSLKVMHYNVKGNFAEDFSASGSQVQAIGRQLAYLQPDVVTLNEIPVGKTYVITNLVNEFLPGYSWATNSGTDGAIRSVILSRWRVLRSESWLDGAPLSSFGHAGNFTRDLFEAEIEVPGYVQPLHVFTTHLKSGSGADECLKRAAEANAISNYFVNGFLTTNSGRPYLLTGDLNEDINRPTLHNQQAVQKLRNAETGLQLTTPLNPFDSDDRTFSIQSLPLAHRYDYILPGSSLSGQIVTSQVFRTSVLSPLPPELGANDDATASDHLPVVVEFSNPSFVPPIVLVQPEDRVVAPGASVSWTVEVASAAPVTYLWKKDGVSLSNDGNISGVDTATLTLAAVSEGDAGLYSVAITNIYGGVISDDASLSIAVPPVITSEPVGSTNVVGTTAVFAVEVSGTEPLSFQWKKGATPLSDGGSVSGATSATLTLTGVVEVDSGFYSVTVTNLAGSVESAEAELTVVTPPVITGQPGSRTVSEGGSFNLTVTATGTAPLNYQWHLNSAAISGATDGNYSVGNVSTGDAGEYFVVVANDAGSVTSAVAKIQVAVSETTLSPANLVVLRAGDSVQSLGNTGNSIYLDQFTTTGDYLSTMAIPESGENAVIFTGTATLEGALSRSANGLFLTFAGYNTDRPAASSVSGLSPAVVPRAVGQIDASGHFTVPAKTQTHYSGSFRSAVSDGADNFWGAGANNGTYYLGNEATGASVQSSIGNTRVVSVFNGNLYMSTGSGTRGIYRFAGLPTSSSTSELLLTTGGTSSPHAFAINETETLVYVADDSNPTSAVGGIQRWDKTGETWVQSYILGTGANFGARGLVVDFSGDAPVIYATTAEGNGNRLIRIVDEGAGSTATTLAAAGSAQVFRGVQFGPDVPQAPAIDVHPMPLALLQGETASFNVTATGTGPLKYQWIKDGTPIPDATSSTYEIAAVMPSDEGSYSVTVSNIVTVVASTSASLTVEADPDAPVLRVTSPKANSIHLIDSLLIAGTALESVHLASVEYDLNGTGLSPAAVEFVANGKASNWNASVNLQPGTNLLTVVATDLGGNQTTVGPLRFYYHTASMLVIETNLNGSVITTNGIGAIVNKTSAALYSGNNTNLFVGRTYKLQAIQTGAPYFILSNWTATWTGQASPVELQTNNLTCIFEMKEGMVLSANFIDNPFYRFGGVYHGLFSDTENGVSFETAGSIVIKVTPKQTFSAKLLVDGNSVAVSGKLAIDGTGIATGKTRMKIADKPELTVNLALDFAGGSDTISGTVSQGTDWTSALVADRMVWSKTNVSEQAQAFTNSYTMLFPGFTNNSEGPVGTGHGLIAITAPGKAKVLGYGGDFNKMKQATYVSKDGQLPFYSAMYPLKRTNNLGKAIKETQGMKIGWLTLETNFVSGNRRPTGEIHWIKTDAWTNSTYTAGFTNVVDVLGSRWMHDKLAPGNTLTNMPLVSLGFTEGGLGSSFRNVWTVTEKATFKPFTFEKPSIYVYENSVKASLAAKSGLFKGTFIDPATPEVKTKYIGAILQDENYGEGTFMGTSVGGKVTLDPLFEAPIPDIE